MVEVSYRTGCWRPRCERL